ncbi:MAG: hypothetical protein OXG72_04835 [Acidobacteria bacterium]|nr:hypothetical protein [Acidobacteriota bacterium]
MACPLPRATIPAVLLSALEGAIERTLASPAWTGAATNTDRARLMAGAVEHAFGTHSPPELAEAYRRALRNQRIRQMFNGRNHRELAERFNLTPRQLRRVLRHR